MELENYEAIFNELTKEGAEPSPSKLLEVWKAIRDDKAAETAIRQAHDDKEKELIELRRFAFSNMRKEEIPAQEEEQQEDEANMTEDDFASLIK